MSNLSVLHPLFEQPTGKLLKSEQVASFPKGAPLRQVVSAMAEKNYGCAVITDYGRPVGIFTERDLLRKVVSQKLDLDQELVEKHMTAHPVCVGVETPVKEVMKKMRAGKFRHLVLTDDDGMLSGILSVKDVLDYLVDGITKSL
jgi:CBS domain-containing protein